MGNEAVARGAIEGNCQFASSYPGTPSSEVLETLARVGRDLGVYAQWSTNEAVAIWSAAGASYCGLRSLCSAKHHGVAWMTDILINFAHWRIGNGGLVVAIGDDPQGHSSSNEYDSRNLAARVFEIPILEPADPQEAKDFTKEAFEFSEKLKSPIYVRMTTRTSHATGDVILGELPKEKRIPEFVPTSAELGFEMIQERGWVDMGYLHEKIHKVRLKEAAEVSNIYPGNTLTMNGDEELGVIASGVTRHYVEEAVDKLGASVAFLQLGMSFPLPTEKVSKLIKSVKRVVIFEETDPIIELNLRAFAKDDSSSVEILGKMNEYTPVSGELNTLDVVKVLSKALKKPLPAPPARDEIKQMLDEYKGMRMITLCAGCPHRASGYAIKKAIEELSYGDYIGVGDIGCYGMMGLPPLRSFMLTNCMGGSIGISNGIAKTGVNLPVIAFIGDSTFYHAGIPSLINATFNNAKFTTVILDNEVTGMTGFQPHPGSGYTAMGEKTSKVKIEDIVKACGIENVEIVDPYNIRKSIDAAKRTLSQPKASVIIFRRVCSTEMLKQRRAQGLPPPKPLMVDPDLCNGCMACTSEFGCPAIIWDDKNSKARIDYALCCACGACVQICRQKAIKGGVKK
ncbi:MAG: thiamine pyrophosphate-dependent enzyme [Candidatus Atabeyarchaeum deiterrae]